MSKDDIRKKCIDEIVNNNYIDCDASNNIFSIYINNVRGVTSKLPSLHSIISSLDPPPDVICLNEINLKKNKKLNIKGYKAFNKNR